MTGVTLIELLCVIAIIAILASLMLPSVSRAYRLAKGMSDVSESEPVHSMLQTATRAYCAANPRYRFESRSDLSDKCNLPPKCRTWIDAPTTEFVPFTYLDPTNKTVLLFRFGPKREYTSSFTKSALTVTPIE